MDELSLWLLAALGLCVLAVWWGLRIYKRADAKRRGKRSQAEAATRSQVQRIAVEEAARQQARRKAAAVEAARAETALLAREEAARAEAQRLAAQDLAAKEAVRAEAARAAAEKTARFAAQRQAEEEAQRARATRFAEEQAARAIETARLASERAARADAARLAEAARVAEVARLDEAARLAAAAREAEAVRLAESARMAEAARLEAERELRALAAAPAVPGSVPEAPAARAKTPGQTVVMVADDSKIVRVKTGRLLAQHQYQVAYATDGLDAAQQIQASMPDVVITDVEMPGMDGFELTKHVRQNPLTAHIPVIMITAADDRHREDADRAGVSVLLGKPYPEDELIAHIRLAMNHGETQAGALA